MKSLNDEILALSKLVEEGRLSKKEYNSLKEEILENIKLNSTFPPSFDELNPVVGASVSKKKYNKAVKENISRESDTSFSISNMLVDTVVFVYGVAAFVAAIFIGAVLYNIPW